MLLSRIGVSFPAVSTRRSVSRSHNVWFLHASYLIILLLHMFVNQSSVSAEKKLEKKPAGFAFELLHSSAPASALYFGVRIPRSCTLGYEEFLLLILVFVFFFPLFINFLFPSLFVCFWRVGVTFSLLSNTVFP